MAWRRLFYALVLALKRGTTLLSTDVMLKRGGGQILLGLGFGNAEAVPRWVPPLL